MTPAQRRRHKDKRRARRQRQRERRHYLAACLAGRGGPAVSLAQLAEVAADTGKFLELVTDEPISESQAAWLALLEQADSRIICGAPPPHGKRAAVERTVLGIDYGYGPSATVVHSMLRGQSVSVIVLDEPKPLEPSFVRDVAAGLRAPSLLRHPGMTRV